MPLNYQIGRGSLCVGDLVGLGLSGVRVAGCWRFGAAGFEYCPFRKLLEIWWGWV